VRRQRVVPGFWAADAAQQAADADSAAATAAGAAGPAEVGTQAEARGGVFARAASVGAAAGHDAAYSDSSWSTLDDEEEHASNKQQHVPQQQAPGYSPALGDEALTPPRPGSKSRTASGSSKSAANSTGSSPSSSSQRLPHQHPKQHHSGPWRPQRHADMSQSLEGLLFGMGGRVSGEVSQTFSPLKTTPAGQCFWSPGSPLTPLKQGKP
jgi:hypothetical protein